MTGKEFEQIILERFDWEERVGRATCSRYGVQVSFRPLPDKPGQVEPVPIRSLPDFEGILAPDRKWQEEARAILDTSEGSLHDLRGLLEYLIEGQERQFIFDAKVCSASSFSLAEFRREGSKNKSRQLRHLMTRARFGATCFLLIHFSRRVLKRRVDPEETFAFPVHPHHSFWVRFEAYQEKSINRDHCREYGVPVEWNALGGTRKKRPDLVWAIESLRRMKHPAAAEAVAPF